MSSELEQFLGQLISIRRLDRGWVRPSPERQGQDRVRWIECNRTLDAWSGIPVDFWDVADTVANRRGSEFPRDGGVTRDEWRAYVGHLGALSPPKAVVPSLVRFLFPDHAADWAGGSDELRARAWRGEFDQWLAILAQKHWKPLALSFSWFLAKRYPQLRPLPPLTDSQSSQRFPWPDQQSSGAGASPSLRAAPPPTIAPPPVIRDPRVDGGQRTTQPDVTRHGRGASTQGGLVKPATPTPSSTSPEIPISRQSANAPSSIPQGAPSPLGGTGAAPVVPAPAGSSWVWRRPDPALPPPPAPEWATSTDGFSRSEQSAFALLVGATVRGKGHKQDGLYGDDSFGLAHAGKWRVMAVSDGAGSSRLSRFGSHHAVRSVIDELVKRLSYIDLSTRVFEPAELQQLRNHDWPSAVVAAYRDSFLLAAQSVVGWVCVENTKDGGRGACRRALDAAVRTAAAESGKYRKRVDSTQAGKLVEINPSDCNATLLVATTTRIWVRGSDGAPKEVLLVASCAIGDGMIVAFRKPGGKAPYSIDLMVPDAGQYSGESVFLSTSQASPDQIEGRFRLDVVGAISDVAAIAAMSDGVGDDYYGTNVGMQRLLCDLVANGILPTPPRSPARVLASSTAAVVDEPVLCEMTGGSSASRRVLPIAYVDRAIAESKLTVVQALESPSVLAELSEARLRRLGGFAMSQPSPEALGARIRDWLDTYTARGSYDDRTLVMIVERDLGH